MSMAEGGAAGEWGARLTDRMGVGVLTRLIDRDLVDDVLAETGRGGQRSRLLPARVVVYYVIALCLFFGDAYEEVMRLLVDGLGFAGSWRNDWTVPTTGAIAQARQRLGAEPLRVLFEQGAVPRAEGHARRVAGLTQADGHRRVRAGRSRYGRERRGIRPVRGRDKPGPVSAGAPGRAR